MTTTILRPPFVFVNNAPPITRDLIEELKALSRTPEHRAHELHATHCHLSAQAWGELSRASEAVARALRCDAPHGELQALRAARDAADANVTALLAEIEVERGSSCSTC
jgi:hypothetical protein